MISIRQQLTVRLTLHLVLAVLLGGALIWYGARQFILSQFDATLMARAELIQSTVEEDDGHLEIEFNLSRLPEFKSGLAPVHFQIRSRNGQPLITSPQFNTLHLPPLPGGESGAPSFLSFKTPDGSNYRALQVQFDAVDDRHADYSGLRLIVVRQSAELHSRLLQLGIVVAGAAALSLAFLVPLVRRDLKKGLQPLEEFAARTGAIDVRQLPQRVAPDNAPAELQPMVEKLNELLERVHQSLLRERRFTRDVAHELRTPVAELKSIAEVASRWIEEATPEAFAEVRDIAGEMESLVASLTLLNRLDAGTAGPESLPVSLSGIVRQTASRLEEQASRKGQHLDLPPAAEDITWETDPTLAKVAVANLMENAVAYSPPGARIVVTLDARQLSVSNPAPDLSPEDVSQMTHAFWRKDAARADQTHSGLGLALVESIARVLHFDLHIALSADRILTFTLTRTAALEPDA